ncbi:MAG TPA: hypothetical protein VGN00_14110 [Puia sp.]|jgi:hypothetical protein
MTDYYLLTQLVEKTRKLREAQEAYIKQPGDPKTDQLKKAHWAERKRREEDVDRLLPLIKTARPELFC